MVVYEGFLTKLITQQLSLSVPYYSKVRDSLLKMGCVRQLKRGGGTAPSQWELLTAPTPDLFELLPVRVLGATQSEILQQRVDDLTARLATVEAQNKEIMQSLIRIHGVQGVAG